MIRIVGCSWSRMINTRSSPYLFTSQKWIEKSMKLWGTIIHEISMGVWCWPLTHILGCHVGLRRKPGNMIANKLPEDFRSKLAAALAGLDLEDVRSATNKRHSDTRSMFFSEISQGDQNDVAKNNRFSTHQKKQLQFKKVLQTFANWNPTTSKLRRQDTFSSSSAAVAAAANVATRDVVPAAMEDVTVAVAIAAAYSTRRCQPKTRALIMIIMVGGFETFR